MNAKELIGKVVDAHGGETLWRRCRRIRLRLTAEGLAFSTHWQGGALVDRQVVMDPHARYAIYAPYPKPGQIGHWTPDRVWIVDESGATLRERNDPRSSYAKPIKTFVWDDFDMLYFAGYALWNYLGFPFLLAGPGVDLELDESETEVLPGCLALRATFAPGYPTHSPKQSFHIDKRSLRLERHDYVADPIGRWASAANKCLDSQVVGGLRFYTRRLVHPRFGDGFVLPGPTLVRIEMSEFAADFD